MQQLKEHFINVKLQYMYILNAPDIINFKWYSECHKVTTTTFATISCSFVQERIHNIHKTDAWLEDDNSDILSQPWETHILLSNDYNPLCWDIITNIALCLVVNNKSSPHKHCFIKGDMSDLLINYLSAFY